MSNFSRRIHGFTLVELMVSLAIAMIAILAASELYLSTRQTYRVQTMQNRLAEDGRFAVSMLQRIVTQAGFKPTPATSWVASFPTQTPLTPTSATSMTVRFIADGANQITCDSAVASANSAQQLTISSGSGKLSCGATDWIDGAGAGSELADFKLDYGVDNTPTTASDFGCGPDVTPGATRTGDCVADTYVLTTAQGVPAQIVAVKACLVLRSATTDTSVTRSAAYKNCSDGDIADSLTDRKLYRTFRTTVLVRNR